MKLRDGRGIVVECHTIDWPPSRKLGSRGREKGSRSFTAPLKYGERLGDVELDHVATDDRFLLLIFGRGNDRSVIRVFKGRRRFSRVGKERSNDR